MIFVVVVKFRFGICWDVEYIYANINSQYACKIWLQYIKVVLPQLKVMKKGSMQF